MPIRIVSAQQGERFLYSAPFCADVIINYDSDKEEKTCKTFLWEIVDDYSRHKELLSVDNGPVHEAKI